MILFGVHIFYEAAIVTYEDPFIKTSYVSKYEIHFFALA
jgi:hypothetical protein